LLPEVDYVSIGSNDLTQYVMAADRDNPKVAHLCEPFSPPVFRLLTFSPASARKPATLCGEMAGRPRCFLALGMGPQIQHEPGVHAHGEEAIAAQREMAERVARAATEDVPASAAVPDALRGSNVTFLTRGIDLRFTNSVVDLFQKLNVCYHSLILVPSMSCLRFV
jgi:phosphoenolpyruvate-protein kinase (PTS system EI component)